MRKNILSLLFSTAIGMSAQSVSQTTMQAVYEEVKTPYKYGMVVAPADTRHQTDCPTVFRHGGKWLMTYVVYNGKGGLDGRGYETWLASSADLLHWTTLGRILSYRDKGWDMNQRGGFPALIDWTWGGSYAMNTYKGKHWMTYIGGAGTGYEAVREPLNVGLAWTKGDPSYAHEWRSMADRPLLSIHDKGAQWWEKLVQYKSTVYEDKAKTLGKRFMMFYNAGGVNPKNNLKAERIGIALSDDMKHWERYAGNPVYAHEAPGIITGDAQIVKMTLPHAVDNRGQRLSGPLYVMFYFSAYHPQRRYNAFNTFAVSTDLVHWQDWTGPDLIYPTKPYDDMFAHKSCVVKHQGVVYHFYCAVNKVGQRGIAVATSVPMGRSAVAFPTPEKGGKRVVTDLNRGWTTSLLTTNQDSLAMPPATRIVNLPHNWDDYYGYRQLKHGNLHGSAVYTKTFQARKRPGRQYFLHFEGIGSYARVMLNGHAFSDKPVPVGRTVYTLNVTSWLNDGANSLRVEVAHPEMITDMPWVCGGCSAEWGFSEGSQPFGIFRPVTLEETDEVRIEPFGVHIWNNAACDSIFIDTEVKNYSRATVEIELVNKLNRASGKTYFRLSEKTTLQPGETKTIRQQTAIDSPHRWSLDDPYLYHLATMIKREGGKTTDESDTEFGIRSISWPVHAVKSANTSVGQGPAADTHRFLLNGKPVFINGTCEYEHLFGGSHAFSHEQIASRVKQIRQAGFNAFREAHQPHNLYYGQLFDEQGMLFWSQFSAHIWYDTPEFRTNFKEKLRQWVKERRNSPSIILWGLQNESVLPKDFVEECRAIIRELDPTAIGQRAVTTCNGGEGTDWNVVQNWSGTYGGSADNYARELKHSDQLLNGEYGAWRTLGLHGADRYSEEAFTGLLSKKALLAESARDSVCGHFQWLFVSHENPGRVQPDEALRRIDKVGPFNYKGLLTPWEQPTEAFYWYRNHYVDTPADTLTPTAADRNRDLLKPADGYTYLYRLNCGGDAYTDSYGHEWLQDDTLYSESWSEKMGLPPFMASQGHITDSIHGTVDAPLFQYFRWGRHALKWHFSVPDNRLYRIELYFAEPWLGARYGAAIDCEGERIFDVAVNDSVVIDNLDLWAEAGFAGDLKRVVYARAENGQITIGFPEVKAGQAVISAIAIASDAPEAMPVRLKTTSRSKTFWADLDRDTIARYPKEMLPRDVEAFPAVRYQEASEAKKKTGKARTAYHEWTVTPGVAREYMLRFRYKNVTGRAIKSHLTVTNAQGGVLVDREMTFPTTPDKFKTIGTTTGTQINAGSYRVRIKGAENIEFDYLEVQ